MVQKDKGGGSVAGEESHAQQNGRLTKDQSLTRGERYRGNLFGNSFGSFNNRPCSDTKVINEFIRLPTVRNCAHGELVHLDAFWPDRAEHRIPEAAVCIVIFNGEDTSLRGPGTVQQRCAIDGDDTI